MVDRTIKYQCEARVLDGWHSRQCSKNATVERDGKHYCAIHDPVRIKEKNEALRVKWKKEDEIKEYKFLANAYCKSKGLSLNDLKEFALSRKIEGGKE